MAFPSRLASALVAATLALVALPARAEESLIERPGAHKHYAVELEPHLAFTFLEGTHSANGFGGGARATFPVLHQGPITSINDSLAIGVGVDYLTYDGCYWSKFACGGAKALWVPGVVQWNFWFSPSWSAFAELGLALRHVSHEDLCIAVDKNGNGIDCKSSDNSMQGVGWLGGRYHFTPSTTLVLRVGLNPYWTLGVSFM